MSKLTDRLFAARDDMRKQRRLLARARRLYVRFCRHAIAQDLTGDVLEQCAARMLDSGMYSDCQPRSAALHDIRYSILRQMWRLDSHPGARAKRIPMWHEWAFQNGWAVHVWKRLAA